MRRIVLSIAKNGVGRCGAPPQAPGVSIAASQLLHPSSPSSIPGRAQPVTVACGAGRGAGGQRPAGLGRVGAASGPAGLGSSARQAAQPPFRHLATAPSSGHRAPARRRPRSQSSRPSPADPPLLLAAADSRPTPAATRAPRPALRTRAARRALRAPLMWPPGGYPDPRPHPGGHPPAAGSPARPPASDPAGSLSSGFPAHPLGRIPTRASSAHRFVRPGASLGSRSRSLPIRIRPKSNRIRGSRCAILGGQRTGRRREGSVTPS